MQYETPLLMSQTVKNRLKLLPFEPRTVLDIGAYEGYWSKGIKEVFPECSPFMIEGNPNKDVFLKNTGYRYEISLLSDEEKITDFYVYNTRYTTGSSIYPENKQYTLGKYQHTIYKILTNTLKNIVQKNNLIDIDLIKLDVQGAEKEIMLGGLDIIRQAKAIIIELSLIEYNCGAPLMIEILTFMDSIGFKMIDIIELHYGSTTNILEQFDAIFMRK